MAETITAAPGIRYPHITIEYCTQCKWMLRAAYFAQELLSTFSSTPSPSASPTNPPIASTTTSSNGPPPPTPTFSLPAITLLPSTGGTFRVTIYTTPTPTSSSASPGTATPGTATTPTPTPTILWDRKTDGGFPETKELKRRVRDVVDPGRGLGHVDREYGKKKVEGEGKEGKVEVEVKDQATGEGGIGKEEKEKEVGKGTDGEEKVCMDCL